MQFWNDHVLQMFIMPRWVWDVAVNMHKLSMFNWKFQNGCMQNHLYKTRKTKQWSFTDVFEVIVKKCERIECANSESCDNKQCIFNKITTTYTTYALCAMLNLPAMALSVSLERRKKPVRTKYLCLVFTSKNVNLRAQIIKLERKTILLCDMKKISFLNGCCASHKNKKFQAN